MCSQASQNADQREPAARVLPNDFGRLCSATNLRKILRPSCTTFLRAEKRVCGGLRGDISPAVRDVPPARDGQATQHLKVLVSLALHGLDFVGRFRVCPLERRRNHFVIACLSQKSAPRFERTRGHHKDARKVTFLFFFFSFD